MNGHGANSPKIQQLKPYPKYKDSGVEWLEEIPVYWESKRLKLLLKAPLKYGANEAVEMNNSELQPYVRITDIDKNPPSGSAPMPEMPYNAWQRLFRPKPLPFTIEFFIHNLS